MEVYHGRLDLFNTKCIIPNMERLVCEGSCPFKRMCGVMANQKGVFCGDEIKSVLKATDLEADGKYKVNGSVSTSKGAVPV